MVMQRAADPPPQLKALAPSFTSPQGAPRWRSHARSQYPCNEG
jgi:hypothetical protein